MSTPSGADWQKAIERLCTLECRLCGEDYIPIPDQVDGDGGLEGFTTAGIGYQCYSDQHTINTTARMLKQKKKVTTDLKKLLDRRVFMEPLFKGRPPLKRWFLVCPELPDKSVLVHCCKHAEKLRAHKLPYIDPAFEAFAVTADHFEIANEWKKKLGTTSLDLAGDEPSAAELADFRSQKSQFIQNIDRKLTQVLPGRSPEEIVDRRNQYLRYHLVCENSLKKVFVEEPSVRERLDAFIARKGDAVQFESGLDDTKPSTRLITLKQSLSNELAADFKMISRGMIEGVGLGTIASWLGQCPLHFDGEGT